MKKLLLLAFILLPAKQIFSCSNAGGDITYRYQGNGVYEVTFTHYNLFSGIVPSYFPMDIENSCGYPFQLASLQMVAQVPATVYPFCLSEPAGCTSLPNFSYDIQKYIYRAFIILPAECEQWTFSVHNGGRNPGLTTINFPELNYGHGLTFTNYYSFYISASVIYSDLPNFQNESPLFLNDPEFFACKDEVKYIEPGIMDPDGDSIVCRLIAPEGGPNISVNYLPGYSGQNPFTSSQPIVFDQSSGNMLCKPVQSEFTIVAYEVSEFRDGKLIGRIVRDFNLLIKDCENNFPELSGFLNLPVNTLSICAGQQTCLSLFSTDADACDSTSITWDHGIPGATFFTSGNKFDEGLFCWQPGFADISSIPYTFTATVTDNKCMEKGTKKYDYHIFVVEPDATCLTMSTENNTSNHIGLRIFPQPASDIIYIDQGKDFIPGNTNRITISNILGETIYQSQADNQVVQVDIPAKTSPGIYSVFVTDPSGRIIQKDKIILSR